MRFLVVKWGFKARHRGEISGLLSEKPIRGMCVVAAVMEGDRTDEHMLKKARIEKDLIKSIMKEH